MTNAIPLPAGTCRRNCSMASSPPAEAPIPTIGNETPASGADASCETALADLSGRRFGEVLVFMTVVSAALNIK
jgi:hypothetical protein